MKDTPITVAGYLLRRLKQIGVDHLFGVPGDFVLGFLNQVLQSDVQYIGTCNELNAAYAADEYARLRGIGALVTTYGVGELSALNGVAGAFAERVPVVVITGVPAMVNFHRQPQLHHTLGDYQIPRHMYEMITVAATQLVSGATAPAEIDRVLAMCLARQQPVYLSLPADVVSQPCAAPGPFGFPAAAPSNPAALAEALTEAVAMLAAARQPAMIAGVELIRFHLQAELAGLLHQTGFPYATMLLGKSVLSEQHPQFIGLYEGERSRPYVRSRIEAADCILQLGSWLTDFNTGGFTANLAAGKLIRANIDSVKIRNHHYPQVSLRDFIVGLTARLSRREPASLDIQCAATGCVHRQQEPYQADPGQPLTIRRFFDRMAHYVRPQSVVLAETGLSLFSAAEMLLPAGATFIGQTFYGSIGYTLGATLGTSLAAPGRPVVLFVGDGSFQVTGQELSTLIRHRLQPVIFLINNDGYTIERVISDQSYNDLQPWRYHQLVEVFGGGRSYDVHTEGDLENALRDSAGADELVFIEIHTGRLDCSESLRRAGQAMARANQLG